MPVFSEYADYYNLFYAEKNYKAEIDYINLLIRKYSHIPVKNILNIGCGTGNHDQHLVQSGYIVDAIDMSEKMLNIARKRNPENVNYILSSSIDFNTDKKYDCIVSLFHVLSYHNTNDEVNRMFEIVKNNLKPGGVFLFDFWYGPGVLNDPPVVRVKEFENETEVITRIAAPESFFDKNIVAVNYTLLIRNKKTGQSGEIKETHNMRYFFKPELLLFAEKNNLSDIQIFDWLTENDPHKLTWNGIITGSKK